MITFHTWTTALADRGIAVLAPSHVVPVEIWALDDRGDLLHFTARGTTVALRRYDVTDLTRLILRSECDCEEHRQAGAARRIVLAPGATPLVEAVVDGAAEFGWSGIEAGLLTVASAAPLFDRLLAEINADAAVTAVAVA